MEFWWGTSGRPTAKGSAANSEGGTQGLSQTYISLIDAKLSLLAPHIANDQLKVGHMIWRGSVAAPGCEHGC